MNAKGYYEELYGIEEKPMPILHTVKPTHKTEADKARAWLDGLNLETMKVEAGEKAEFYKYEVSVYRATAERFYLTARSPQAKQHHWSMGDRYGFGTPDDIRAGLERFIGKMEEKNARRQAQTEAKRKARADFQNPYKVGDFLYSSWGYEQTNREFYQVLEVRPLALHIRQVAQNRERTGHDSGVCSPVQNRFIEESRWVTIQVDKNGYFSVPSPIHGSLYAYEGKPVYFSDGY